MLKPFNAFLVIAFVVLTSSVAQAERNCTKERITHPDGSKEIITKCSASWVKDKDPDIIRRRDLKEKQEDLMDRVQDRLQQARDKQADQASSDVTQDDKADDVRKKQQELIDAVRMKQEEHRHRF
jgi:hypothetical protein